MGRRLHYKPGSFYRTDDRSGFPTRAERTQKEWNGYIVDERLWEPRQPQDLVRGMPDYQAVPEARPLAPNQFVGPVYVQTAAAVGPTATRVPLESVAFINVGDAVGLMLDNGSVFQAVVQAILPNAVVQVSPPIPSAAASGNEFIDYRRPPPA